MKKLEPKALGAEDGKSSNQRWHLLEQRDPQADGSFFYGVRTTGVYCKPSCRSRKPLRENVVFFDSSGEAKKAGFRPCHRCKPDEIAVEGSRLAGIVRAACKAIGESEEPPKLDELAKTAGLSASRFQRLFKQATGVTPKQYAIALRSDRARRLMRDGAPIGDAIYAAGFGASSRFYENAKGILGMKPSAYRNGAANESIRVAIEKTSLGYLLVAATSRGICQIALGDSRKALMDEFKGRFSKAMLNHDDPVFAGWIREIVALIEKPGGGAARLLSLPLNIQGTAFQRRVWQELQKIPFGTTTTYTDLAAKAGRPRAVRAAGTACGANPTAIVVPCHRVVRSDGALGGYRWGLERKKKLLAKEKAIRERQ